MIKQGNRIITNSTILLLPIFGLPKKEYDKAGFVNAYIGYEGRHYGGPTLFLVFYAKERYADELDDIITMMDSAVLDFFGYQKSLVILVLQIPKQFQWDFHNIIHSNYSKVSDAYRQMVSDKTESKNKLYDEKVGKRLPLLIVDRDPLVQTFIENKYDIQLNVEGEVWERFDIDKETLNDALLTKIIYTPFWPTGNIIKDMNNSKDDSTPSQTL
jgi:hypothetical protein